MSSRTKSLSVCTENSISASVIYQDRCCLSVNLLCRSHSQGQLSLFSPQSLHRKKKCGALGTNSHMFCKYNEGIMVNGPAEIIGSSFCLIQFRMISVKF